MCSELYMVGGGACPSALGSENIGVCLFYLRPFDVEIFLTLCFFE